MAGNINLFPKETLINVIKASDVQSQLEIFQILDSLLYYLRDRGIMPTVRAFDIAPKVTDIALFIDGFLKSCKPDDLAEELTSFDNLRPHQACLAVLPPFDTQYGGGFTVGQLQHWHDHAGKQKYNLIQNFDHAMQLDAQLHMMNNKMGKTADVLDCEDFPATDEERKVLVDKLVAAMVNYTGIIEKPVLDRKRRRTRQGAGSEAGDDEDAPATKDNYRVERVKNTSNVELQILAWKLLYFIKDAQDGHIYLPDRHGKQAEYTNYPSFMGRYEKVVEALRASKALVGDLMAWDHARRLVATPDKEHTRKRVNKDGNDKKGDLLKAGIEVTKAKKNRAASGSITATDNSTTAAEDSTTEAGSPTAAANSLAVTADARRTRKGSSASEDSDKIQQAVDSQLAAEATATTEATVATDAITSGEDKEYEPMDMSLSFALKADDDE